MLNVFRQERRPLLLAAATLFALELSEALAASCADALYLGRRGAGGLGVQLALSSALLAISLGIVGALADRGGRARLLAGLCLLGAGVLLALRGALALLPSATPAAILVISKQLAAALDLAFWLTIADRFDARQARRLWPLLMAAGGLGMVAGSLAVHPLVRVLPVGELLSLAALACLLAALPLFATAGEAAPAHAAGGRTRLLRDGARLTRRNELARRLALVALVAGLLGPILYTVLGAAAAARYPHEADLAGFYGRFRALSSLATLAAQLLLAPVLLRLVGVGAAFLFAPVAAAAAGWALVASGGLAVAALAQAGSRVFDAAVETPAEKLAQNLLGREIRGRVAAFLDGVAKRGGALAGGLLVTVMAGPRALAGLVLVCAALWLLVAFALRRRYPALAIAELARRGPSDPPEEGALDEATLRRLRKDLVGRDPSRRELAIEAIKLAASREPPERAVALLLTAARKAPAGRGALVGALDRVLEAHVDVPALGAADELLALLDEAAAAPALERATIVQAFGRLAGEQAFAARRARLAALGENDGADAVRLAARTALARRGDPAALDRVLGEAASASGDAGIILVEELRAEALAVAAGRTRARAYPFEALLERAAAGEAAALAALAEAARRGGPADWHPRAAEVAREAFRREPVRAAAVGLLGALRDRAQAPLLCRALADPDDEVRRAAAAGLGALGVAALPVLLVAARFGRRAARDAALEVLRDLDAAPAALDDIIEAEREEILTTTLRLHALAGAGQLVAARLEERLREATRTLLLVLEARLQSRRVGAAARRLLGAGDGRTRARALEALDALLPRALAVRLLAVLDEAPLEERAARAAEALGLPPPDADAADAAIRAELAGGDPLARALVVHAMGQKRRAAHGQAIRAAASAGAAELDPLRLLKRIHELAQDSDEEDAVPSKVEAMVALRAIPLFADLPPGALAELAALVRWQSLAAGDEVEAEDGLCFVHSGRLGRADGDGDGVRVFGERALLGVEEAAPRLVARERTRLGRLAREDFERAALDEPEIALALCRSLMRERR